MDFCGSWRTRESVRGNTVRESNQSPGCSCTIVVRATTWSLLLSLVLLISGFSSEIFVLLKKERFKIEKNHKKASKDERRRAAAIIAIAVRVRCCYSTGLLIDTLETAGRGAGEIEVVSIEEGNAIAKRKKSVLFIAAAAFGSLCFLPATLSLAS